ncbi:MAG: hypothetical protein ACYSWU_10055 [Planctomycetota bacterium]|jgi:hypothetical protein
MRWIRWACVPLAVCVLTSTAAGIDFKYGSWSPWGSCGQRSSYGYDAPACAAPYYGFQPGCCELPPSPCDNAWAGYCQEKARMRAFCHRLGTGGGTYCGPTSGSSQPMPAAVDPSVDPLPAGSHGPESPPVPRAPGQPPAPGGASLPSAPPPPGPPGGLREAPLPPLPVDLEEPTALPPLPRPLPDETTRVWDRFWPPPGSARDQRADWPRLR